MRQFNLDLRILRKIYIFPAPMCFLHEIGKGASVVKEWCLVNRLDVEKLHHEIARQNM
jgi:hypothetical protein